MGTTLTAALLGDDRLEFAHVGDSRLYLWRDERLEQITDDHSLVGEMVRAGHLTPEAALTHPQRSILSRALGTEPRVEVDSGALELQAGDAVVLCSDGLYSMISEETFAAVLAAVDDPWRVARQLIREAKNEGGHDNITVIVLRFDEADAVATAVLPAVGDAATTGVLPALDTAAAGGEQLSLDQPGDDGEPAGAPDAPPSDEVAAAALPADDAEAAVAASDALPPADEAELAAAPPADEAEAAAAAPPAAAAAAAPPRRHRRRRLWLVVALIALLAVCLVAGAVVADGVYYVGDHDGMVSVYRGLPLRVAGVDLNGLYLQTTTPLSSVAPGVLARIERHDLHTRAAALRLAGRRAGPAVSRRNTELLLLLLVGVAATIAYVSVYAARFHDLRRDSVVTGLIFAVLFLVIHLVERRYLAQADPYLVPIAALLSAIGLTEIYRIAPALAWKQGEWLLIGVGLFVATVLVVRDVQPPRRLPLPVRPRRPAPAGADHRRRHERQRRPSVDPRGRLFHPAVGVRQDRHRHLSGRLLEPEQGDAVGADGAPARRPGAAPQVLRSAARDVGAVAAHAGLHEGLRHVASVHGDLHRHALHGHHADRLRDRRRPAVCLWRRRRLPVRAPRPRAVRHLDRPLEDGRHQRLPAPAVAVRHGRRRRRRRRLWAWLPALREPRPDRARPADRLHLQRHRQRARPDRRHRPDPAVPALRLARLPRRPARLGRLLQAAGGRPRHRVRPAELHHHRRRHPAHPADRHHAAVRELRRQLAHRQPGPRGAAAHGLAPQPAWSKPAAPPSACAWRSLRRGRREPRHQPHVHRRGDPHGRPHGQPRLDPGFHAGALQDAPAEPPPHRPAAPRQARPHSGLRRLDHRRRRERSGFYYRTYPQGAVAPRSWATTACATGRPASSRR